MTLKYERILSNFDMWLNKKYRQQNYLKRHKTCIHCTVKIVSFFNLYRNRPSNRGSEPIGKLREILGLSRRTSGDWREPHHTAFHPFLILYFWQIVCNNTTKYNAKCYWHRICSWIMPWRESFSFQELALSCSYGWLLVCIYTPHIGLFYKK